MIFENNMEYFKKSSTLAGTNQKCGEHITQQSASYLDSTIHQRFDVLAREIPNETAVILSDLPHETKISSALTYGELNRRAEVLSLQLSEVGVRNDQFIAVFRLFRFFLQRFPQRLLERLRRRFFLLLP